MAHDQLRLESHLVCLQLFHPAIESSLKASTLRILRNILRFADVLLQAFSAQLQGRGEEITSRMAHSFYKLHSSNIKVFPLCSNKPLKWIFDC